MEVVGGGRCWVVIEEKEDDLAEDKEKDKEEEDETDNRRVQGDEEK